MKRLLILAVALAIAIPAIAAEIDSLDAVDASNTARFPENMSPAAVNDGMRALEGIIARWRGDESCVIASAGTSSVWTFSATRTLTAYYDGLKVCLDAHTAPDGAVTLNVDSLGAKSVVFNDGSALGAGDVEAGDKIEMVYDGTNFVVMGPRGADAVQSTMESEAATGYVTPDVVVHSPYVSKGWAYFTVSGSAIGTITGQNVTTVAYDAAGNFVLDWTTDFSSAAYACTATAENATLLSAHITAITAGGTGVRVANTSGTATDPLAVSIICFGDR